MTTPEIKAELRTIKKLTKDESIKALCDVLLDFAIQLDKPKGMGFK